MADLKISQLTGATTPLAGTEVVPLVQSSTTKKVSVANLTEGRSVGAAKVNIGTSSEFGLLNVSSSGANDAIATLGDFTTPGNSVGIYGRVNGSGVFSIKTAGVAIRLSSDVGLANPVDILNGNIIPGTAAKGVNFTANIPAAGMTSQLLNWYEEGTFTPTIVGTGSSGVGTYSSQVGRYTRIGRQVTVQIELAWSAHTGTGNMFVAGLPFACSTVRSSISAISYDMALAANCYLGGRVTASDTTIELLNLAVGGGAWSGVAMDTSVVALVVTAIYTV